MLRDTFDTVAERYDRARPSYPPPLVGQLARSAGLGPSSRVLEIGPGTGQLTRPLAETGCRLTAVELGPSLAAVARRNLDAFPQVDVAVADFERWPLPAEPFDLVVSATAFHWIDPALRVAKTADALRPGGLLALVTTHHVKGGSVEFFADAQGCYERWDPATPPGLRLEPEDDIASDTRELTLGSRYEDVTVHRHAQEVTYSADAYIEVLLTYSGHLALDEPARRGLLACIRNLIENRYGGSVTKRYLHELITARRTAG
ncbi:class I SAM-dependent methyltransferase [Streptomyces aurantiogriseus]|uniref:Methyltransferase type 11 n=1 Tax=Streptomyces aurantiogriseus TaxID=66870 RepID=A0A918FKG2_9ACTN|nr:class I SAM-dependent methyltransferase [Streptomyces aurantiogriseus]GGR45968.1 methyltransferase type 11 [Streptomyces aurantiogriseus]